MQATLALLRLGAKNLLRRKARTALTAAGIALGVAVATGVLVSNASTLGAFDRLFTGFLGGADVLVSPVGGPDATMDEERVRALAELEGVEASSPVFALPTTFGPGRTEEALRLILEGVDPERDARLRPYELADGRLFTPGAPEVIVDDGLTAQLGIAPGDRVEVVTPSGRHEVIVTGTLVDAGLTGSARGGNLVLTTRVVTSLETARLFAEAEAGYTGVAVGLVEGTDAEGWIARNEDALEGLDATPGVAAQLGLEEGIGALLGGFAAAGGIAFVVGGALVYLTLSRTVAEQERTHGLMRAVGAGRGHLRALVVAGTLVLAMAATVVGLGLGLAVARAVLALVTMAFGFPAPDLVIPAEALLLPALMGIGVAGVAALIPAVRAARVDPAVAMRAGPSSGLRARRGPLVGAVLLGGGVALGFANVTNPFPAPADQLPMVATLVGAILLAPLGLRPVAWLVGKATSRLARGNGEVAVRHLLREQSRSGYTLGLLLVVFAVIIILGGLDRGLVRGFGEAVERQLGADLVIRSPFGVVAPEVEGKVQERPGVRAVSTERLAWTNVSGAETDVRVAVVDPEGYFNVASFLWAEGTEADAQRALARGELLLSDTLSETVGAGLGDTATMETSEGPRGFPIGGVFRSSGSLVQGADLVVSTETAGDALGGEALGRLLVELDAAADPAVVAAGIEEDLGAAFGLQVQTLAELKSELAGNARRFGGVFLAILFVAALIGALGLANTLAISVADRRWEIGVMRAVGSERGRVARMVLAEAATLGLAAVVLAVPLGALLLRIVTAGFSFQGVSIGFAFPTGWVVGLLAVGVVLATLAAVVPAWQAARVRPAAVLRHE